MVSSWALMALGLMGDYGAQAGRVKKYKYGESGDIFKDAHLRAKPLPTLKRSKKTGYVING